MQVNLQCQVTLHYFVTVQTEDRLTCNYVWPCESGHFENWNTCLILKSEMVILWKTRVTFFLSWYPMSSVWYPLGATVKKEFKMKKCITFYRVQWPPERGFTSIMGPPPLAIILGTPQPSGITIPKKGGRAKTLILTRFWSFKQISYILMFLDVRNWHS